MWVSMKAYYLFRGACFPLCFDLRPLVTVDEFQNLPRNGADSNFKKLPVSPSNDELIMDSEDGEPRLCHQINHFDCNVGIEGLKVTREV